MHDHVDVGVGDVEEQVRLDQLQPLVDQGRGVDRDHRAHVPGGVGQRLLGRDVVEVLPAAAAERPAAGGEDQSTHLVRRTAVQALGQRAVLAVDGDDLAGRGQAGDHRSADDQRLLVGQRQGVAGLERGDRGPQPHGPGDAVEHDVALQAGGLDGGVLPEPVVGRGELGDLLLEQLLLGAPGREGHDPEAVGVAADDVEGLGADRPGRPQDDHVTALDRSWGHPIILTARRTPGGRVSAPTETPAWWSSRSGSGP
jgi:hypothetical protein